MQEKNKIKKWITILTLLCFLFTLMPVAAMAESTLPADWAGCTSCSESNPHMIATTADLNKIRTHTYTEDGSAKITGYFKLANDIVFTESDFQAGGTYYNEGYQWVPIGRIDKTNTPDNYTGIYPFSGTLDGNNFKMKNLKMGIPSDSTKAYYSGLFALLGEKGTIKNVIFENCESTVSHKAGIVVGAMIDSTSLLKSITLNNCQMNPLKITKGGAAPNLLAWGLKGNVENIKIENCSFDNNVVKPHYACVVATRIDGVHIDGMEIKDSNYNLYAYVKLFANVVSGKNIIENMMINNVYINHEHGSGTPLPLVGSIASSDSLILKNVNCTTVHDVGGTSGYILPKSTSVTMENCAFHIIADGKDASAYWITNDNNGTWKDISGDLKLTLGKKENGVVIDTTDMYIVDGIYYVNKTNVTTWRDDEIVAYLNGGTFSDETEFAGGKLATPIKEGYTVQWCKDESLTTPVGDDAPTEGNSYYAKWTLCDHTANTAIDCVNPTACSECGASVDPVGHDFENSTVWISNNPEGHYKQCVRCTVIDSVKAHNYDGHADTTCNTCSYERSLVHDFTNGAWVTTDAAYHWKVCADCDAQDTDNKVEHSYTYTSDATVHNGVCVCGRTITNEEHEYIHACDTDCNVCGYVRTIEHDYEWIVDKTANEYETGLKHEECTVCNAVRNVDTVIDMLPSTPSASSSSGFSGSYNYPLSIPAIDNGAVILSDSNATEGESVTATVTPDNGFGVAEVIVTDEDGNIIPVEFIGNSQYTFVMPAGEVDIQVICKPAITMSIGDTELNIFGKTMQNDVAPTIGEGNRTMLPIRAIANALGADVYWDADNQKVTIVKDGNVIEVFIGKDYAFVDGERIQLDVKAYIENDRTYLQVRFITETLDADVIWDPVTRMITIIPN